MKRIDPLSFSVEPGEHVSVVWTPFGQARGQLAMSVDGNPVVAGPANPPRFQFSLAGAGPHQVTATAAFAPGTPPGAGFSSKVSSSDGSAFPGPTLDNQGPQPRTVAMTFRVEDAARPGAPRPPEFRSARAAPPPPPSFAPPPPAPAPPPPPAAAPMPEPSPVTAPGASPAGGDFVVWFGTHRKPTQAGDAIVGFGPDRDSQVHYGTCRVTIPESHTIGSIGSAWWKRILTRTDDRLTIAGLTVTEEDAYWRDMAAVVRQLPLTERHAVVFIHGFNVSFNDAAIRAAQMGFDLQVPGVMAFYSWPSRAKLEDYTDDEATIGASVGFISDYVCDVAERSGAEQVHLIAHSMGNRALLHAAHEIYLDAERRSRVKFSQIILAAPDVDVDEFRRLATSYQQIAERTTLYVCGKDRAVEASRWLHGFARVGLTPPVFTSSGIDTVSVSDLDLTLLGHGYVAEARPVLADIHAVLFDKKPPNERFSVKAARTSTGEEYWEINA